MRKSIPIPLSNELTTGGRQLRLPALIGMIFRQSIPWRVALQQSPPPLPLPAFILLSLASFAYNVSANGFLHIAPVSHKRAHSKTYNSGWEGGPVAVEFDPCGTRLSVTTSGVPDLEFDRNPTLQRPGRLYVYGFADGVLTRMGMYEEVGISGNNGSSWSPGGECIYMTNATPLDKSNDLTVHEGTTAAKVQNFPTGNGHDELCWTLISLDHTKLYAASFATNEVSVFDIGLDGRLIKALDPNFFAVSGLASPDTKDMYEVPGYLYTLGGLNTHSVSVFKTSASGFLTQQGGPYLIPSASGKTKMEYGFQGLTGFEK